MCSLTTVTAFLEECWHVNAIYYLFIINTNTRYLYAYPARHKDANTTRQLIQQFIERESELGHEVRAINGDGDKGFQTLKQSFPNIIFYFQKSKFTYHNKVVDGVIRTLRNALGPNTNRLWDTRHDSVIQQLVQYYNTTYHNGIRMSLIEMHTDIDKEWCYLR